MLQYIMMASVVVQTRTGADERYVSDLHKRFINLLNGD